MKNSASKKSIKNFFNKYTPEKKSVKKTINKYTPEKKDIKKALKKYTPESYRKRRMRKFLNRNELVIGGVTLLALTGAFYAVMRYQRRKHLYQMKYDPGTVFKFQGRIIDIVHENTNGSKESEGIELILQTSESVLPVHLGPAWYLEHQQVKFKRGEKVNITGSMNLSGKDASVVAATVQRGNKKLNLRDENGHPYWYAWN